MISARNVALAFAASAATLLCWHLLWGRLVPLSGIFIGFDTVESELAVVLSEAEGRTQAELVLTLADELIPVVSERTGLPPLRRIGIVLCASDREYRRLTGHSTRFVTLNDRVFVSARALAEANEDTIHLRTYLAHELTHALMFQRQSLMVQVSFPAWLGEGLATYAAEQTGVDGYFDETAVRSWLCQGRSVPPSDYVDHATRSATVAALPESERYHFIYAQFAFFVRDLIERHGRDRFQRYLGAVSAGEDWRRAFVQEFGVAPDSSFDAFRRGFCVGTALPSTPP
jgi:hypothetical protein